MLRSWDAKHSLSRAARHPYQSVIDRKLAVFRGRVQHDLEQGVFPVPLFNTGSESIVNG